MSNIKQNKTVEKLPKNKLGAILLLYKHGYNYSQIGKIVGLTRQRIFQLVKDYQVKSNVK